VIVGASGVAIARQSAPSAAAKPVSSDSAGAPPRGVAPAESAGTHNDSAAAHDTTRVATVPPPAPPPAAAKPKPKPPAVTPLAHKAAAPERTTLIVVSDPFGTVYLDGKQLGDTPMYNLPIEVGRNYDLRIEHEGYKTYHKVIRADGPNPVKQNVTLEPAP